MALQLDKQDVEKPFSFLFSLSITLEDPSALTHARLGRQTLQYITRFEVNPLYVASA